MDASTKVKIIVAVIAVQILLLAFWLWPYSDDFTVGHEHVMDEVVRIIEQNPTREGVDKARTYYNSRESHLKDRFKWGLKPDKNGAIPEHVRDRYQKVLSKASSRLEALGNKYPAIKADVDYLARNVATIAR